jgi:hypothetical protein
MVRARSRHGARRNAYRILVGKSERKRTLERPRHGWEYNSDDREVGWGGMDWIELAEDRDLWMALVNTVMNFRVQENVGKFLSRCTSGGFSRSAPWS